MNLPDINKSKGIVVLVGGLVVVVLFVIFFSKIMQFFKGIGEGVGLSDSKEGKDNAKFIDKNVKQSQQQGVDNPFNPNFYKGRNVNATIITTASANSIAKRIYDSVGYLYDSPGKASAAFHLLKTQAQISFVSEIFNNRYNLDLLTWLNDKFDVNGQREYLRNIIEYVNSLPKYNLKK